MTVTLSLPDGEWQGFKDHLRPRRSNVEEAIFVFTTVDETSMGIDLKFVESYRIPPSGFAVQSQFYIELTDAEKAKLIKRAHDLNAALVEIHSHTMQSEAEFSASDLRGFAEFVPHVRWRLKKRPYAAIVVTQDSFDGLSWAGAVAAPCPLAAILADGKTLFPTGATLRGLNERSFQSK